MAKTGRNDPCPCNSGKKYKRCCLQRQAEEERLLKGLMRGYDYMMQGSSEKACSFWWEAWLVLRSRLRPEMTTTDDAQAIYPLPGSHIHDWLQDLAQEFGNAARHRKSYVPRGTELCRTVLEQFPNEKQLFVQNFRADLGEFYLLDGHNEQGEAEFVALIKDHPEQAVGYVRFAHALEERHQRLKNAADLRLAIDLLQQALNYPVVDANDYSAAKHLDRLRVDIEQLNARARST